MLALTMFHYFKN